METNVEKTIHPHAQRGSSSTPLRCWPNYQILIVMSQRKVKLSTATPTMTFLSLES